MTTSTIHQTDHSDRNMFLWLVMALALCRVIAMFVLPVYDDAFITFRYSRNLAAGLGFVYQPGDWILGTTAPGWGLLSSLFFLAGLPMPIAAVVFNIVLDVTTLLVAVSLLPKENRRIAGLLFGFLFAVSPILNRICVGGMEVDTFVTLSLLAVLIYVRGKHRAAILLSAAAFVIRPEAVVLVGTLSLINWLETRQLKDFLYALVPLAVILAWTAGEYSIYHTLLPQSILAKSHLARPSMWTVTFNLFGRDPLVVPAAVVALIYGILRFKESVLIRILSVWSLLYLGAYLIVRPQVWSWYGEALIVNVLLMTSMALADVLNREPRTLAFLVRPAVSRTVAVAPAMVWTVVLLLWGLSPVTSNVYRPLTTWGPQHVSSSQTVLASDIGAIGYYTNAHIYDLEGLVWPDRQLYKNEKSVINTFWPDWLFLNVSDQTVLQMASPPYSLHYHPVVRFSKRGSQELFPLSDSVPTVWQQDYIMYQRIK